MKLKKDKVIRNLTNEATIKMFLEAGWEEVKDKEKPEKVDEEKNKNSDKGEE